MKIKISALFVNAFKAKYFWQSLFITIVLGVISQLIIYYGSKYDLLPIFISDFALNEFRDSEMVNNPRAYSWDIPYWLELPLFVLLLGLVDHYLRRKRDTIESQSILGKVKIYKIIIVLCSYFIFLSQSNLGRQSFLYILPDKIKDSFEINCSKKEVRLNAIVLKDKNPFLCELCPSKIGCVYSGLNYPESEYKIGPFMRY